MVPTLRCGLVRANFSLDTGGLCLKLTGFLHYRLGDARRHRRVLLEFHRVGRAALGRGTQTRGITEHVRQRYLGTNDLHAAMTVFLVHDEAATRVQVAHHVTQIIRRGCDFDVHDRLEQHRIALGAGFLPAQNRRHLERVFVRVHLVVRAVVQRRLHVDHGITEFDATLHRLIHAFPDGGNELARDRAALDGVHELEALADILRLELDDHVAVLTAATGLLDEAVFLIHGLADGFAVRDLRLADIGLDAEFAPHALDDDLEMQLAHAGDDGLAGLLVGVYAERGIFLGQTAQGHAHLFLVDLGLGLDGLRNHRLWELHALKGDHLVRIAQRLAGGHIFQAHARGDVTGADFLDFLALVGVHLQQTPDALLPALDRVIDGIARGQHSGIHADIGERADKRIGRDLERERRERFVVGGMAFAFGAVLVVQMALDGRALRRRGQKVDDGIERRLHALVLERRTA